MATNKTLSPTNVTIAIPAMDDAPDASVFSNCIDKEADAINTLNSQIAVDWGTKTTAWLESAEQDSSGASAVFSKMGKMITISITTASRTHAENDPIATIESGYRPNAAINAIGYISGTPCVVRFATDGTVKIWLLSGTVTGRLYVVATFATP